MSEPEIFDLSEKRPAEGTFVVFLGSIRPLDGPVTTAEVVTKYVAIYGAVRGERWRYATDEERTAHLAENEAIRILTERFVYEVTGEETLRVTIDELQRINPSITAEDVAVIKQLKPDESLSHGGPGEPTWVVRRTGPAT